jgi:hypothetical protein
MTATEMGYAFDVGYDKITNFDNPGYEPKEKSTFLTQAQENLILEILDNDSYHEFNKRLLDRLKTSDTILAAAMSAGPYTNSFWATLPGVTGPPTRPAIRIVNERAVLTPTSNHFYTGQTFSDTRVKPIDDDYYHLNIKNPHKKPSHDLVWRLDYGDAGVSKLAYIIEPDQVLTSVTIHYYVKPTPIIILDANYVAGDGSIDGVALTGYTATDLDCTLNKIIHREIVDRAVKLAYAALKDEKGFQISSMKEQQ